jgi:non-ribosomal peptide synthetase component E (peptide arylation enzyme)
MSGKNKRQRRLPIQLGALAPVPVVVYSPPAELERYVAEGALGCETLVDGFRGAAQRYPDHIALLGPAFHLSNRKFDEFADRLGAAPRALVKRRMAASAA